MDLTASTRAAFAIPGDMNQRTGGYIYEKSLLLALRESGREVRHVQLPASFPDPSSEEMALAVSQLAALPASEPLILDGLVYGAIDTAGLASVGAPLVAMIHHPLGLETGLEPMRARDLLERERDNLALASHVLVPSPHTARVLSSDFGVPAEIITVAPPGFSRPPPGRRPASPPLILSVGLLAERKGHDVLLRALARLADLDWQAMIVGKTHDPAVRDALSAAIDASGLRDRICLAGEIDADGLDSAFRSASIFALASRYEGYGMVFSEAIAYGLPVVACRAGAVPDTVPPDAGFLVEVDDDSAFAHRLRLILSDEGVRRRMEAAAVSAAAKLKGWEHTAAIAGAVLDRLWRGPDRVVASPDEP